MSVPAEVLAYGPGCQTTAGDRERLILEHLPQVHAIARRIHERVPPSVTVDDLVSVGVVGLIAAIDNYDPSQGAKISTYATYKIRGAMLDSLRSCDWGSRHRRKRCRDIQNAIATIEQRLGRAPTEEEISAELNMSTEEYRAALVDRQALTLESLERVSNRQTETELIRLIPDSEDSLPSRLVERAELERLLAREIEQIPELERTVLTLYYHEELTLAEVARVVKLHISRVSHLKSQAILRLRARIATEWPMGNGGSRA